MSDRLQLRRRLYEEMAGRWRGRRVLRRRIKILAGGGHASGPDDGSAGVREPRRPLPSAGPARRER